MKRKNSKPRRKLSPDNRLELRALRAAARDARKLSIITGTPFWIEKNGKIIDLNKGHKQTAKQKELVRLLRPFAY